MDGVGDGRDSVIRFDDVTLTSRNNAIPGSVTAGSYFVGVILDPAGDTNPSDNVSSALGVTITNSAGGHSAPTAWLAEGSDEGDSLVE